MTIETVKLSNLKPPTENPRRFFCADALQGLAASIHHDGLLQNLVVRPLKGTKTYRVISGERRLRALQLLLEQGVIDGDYPVPVEVRSGLSKDDTMRLAAIENLQRVDLPPLDAARALAKLIRDGEKLEDIVARTGLSVTTIRRRVALNALCKEAREALDTGSITLSQAEAMTLGDAERQRDLLDDLARYEYSAADIRDRLIDDRPSVAMAVFPLELYSGTITTDLFAEGESSYFDDGEQFLALQQQAVAQLAAGYGERYAWVEVTDHHRIADWQYEEAGADDEAGVLVNLSPSGRVEIREGLAKPVVDEQTRTDSADHPDAPRKAKAAYSAPLCRYIGWHKTMAVQEMLLADPRKAKEVAAVAALTGLKAHEALRNLAESEEPQAAYAVLDAQARLFAGWLGFGLDEAMPVWNQFPPYDCDELFLWCRGLAIMNSISC